MEFGIFFKELLSSAKNGDLNKMKGAYADVFEGEVPPEQQDSVLKQVAGFISGLYGKAIDSEESFGDYHLVNYKEDDGTLTLKFRKKGDSWIVFDEKLNLHKFKKVYAIGYNVSGGSVNLLFNGAETPVLRKISSSGFASLINSALVVGENEITLIPEKPCSVSIRISSGKTGDIMDSSSGDVYSFDGDLKEEMKIRFVAE